MINAAAQLDYHCDHLKGFCDLWNKPPKLFLDQYFEFIAAMTEQQKVPLSQKLEKTPRYSLIEAGAYWRHGHCRAVDHAVSGE